MRPLRIPGPAQASGIGRYIKKKQLDPLETYVPLVLEAQEQLLALRGTVGEPRLVAGLLARMQALAAQRVVAGTPTASVPPLH
jgi:hypothetical protein